MSTKKGKEAWIEPVVDGATMTYRFEVRMGRGQPRDGTIGRGRDICLLTNTPIGRDYIRAEGRVGRLGTRLMAIVAEGNSGRLYLSPQPRHETIASQAMPEWRPTTEIPNTRYTTPVIYGMTTHADLFTPRQLVALTTFSDLVAEAQEKVRDDARKAVVVQASSLPPPAGAGWKPAPQREFNDPRETPLAPIRSRGHLPHLEKEGGTYFVTFRLADAVRPTRTVSPNRRAIDPATVTEQAEPPLTLGSCILRRPEVADLVQSALRHFDGQRYRLDAWCVMPNHVHVVFAPHAEWSLSRILHSWKSYTANQINAVLGTTGTIWESESFDHLIRTPDDWQKFITYTESNPVKAGLCDRPEHWPFSSCGAGFQPAQEDREGRQDACTTRAQDYADVVATYLACCVSVTSDDLSSIVTWRSGHGTGATRSTFARQALPMVWDFAETNPFANATGDLRSACDAVAKVINCIPMGTRGDVRLSDAAHDRFSSNLCISTDPPYYDNVPYADLSDFFYIWLRRSLGKIYPDLFGTVLVPKTQELVADPFRHGGRDASRRFFEEGMGRDFANIRAAAHPDIPTTVFYAFKQSEDDTDDDLVVQASSLPLQAEAGWKPAPQRASTGWETMLQGMIDSGMQVTGTWPMRTERGARTRSLESNALASSIVLVCHPRLDDAPTASRREFLTTLKRELPDALRALQHGNIAPVDLAQASIGPGMAVFSRYAKVVESDGSRMGVRTALQLINQALDEVLSEQEGEFDADTRWAIAWFEQSGSDEGPFGTADVLSRAKNTSVEGLKEAGLVASRAGKVRLLRRDELPADWDPATDRR